MLSIWKSALPNSFLNLGAFWIQFGAIWINLKTLSAKWRSHCLGLNVLTYCGQFLVVSIWQSTLPNQFPNLCAMWIKYCFHTSTIVWRMAAIYFSVSMCYKLLLKQNSFCFADDILIHIISNLFNFCICNCHTLKLIWNRRLHNIAHIVSAWVC